MRILDRYLGRAVIGGTILTLAVLLPLLGFFILADEMDGVGEGNYRFLDALQFVVLSMPRYAYQLFPIATLIGALVGLGSLAGSSELVAMRAAGVSIGRIIYAALKAGLLLALIAVGIGEGIAPAAEQHALAMRAAAQEGQVTLQSPFGFWARDGKAFVNIKEILSGTNLRDIYIYEMNDQHELVVSTHARDARYVAGQWVLEDIALSRIFESRIEVERIDQAEWDSLLSPSLLKIVVVEPHVLPVWGLYKYIQFMTINDQDSGAYEVAFWGKIVHPFLIMAMIFVSTPILLGSSRSTGLGRRIFLGILVGIAFYLVSRTFAYLALLFELSPVVAAFTPPLLFLAGALWVLRRAG